MPRRLLLLVIALACASAAGAFDSWPQWRGPNRDGLSSEKNLLDRWEQAPPLAWKFDGLGGGSGSAVVSAGLVCTMGDRNGKPYVIALSEKDGKEVWATKIDDLKGRSYGASNCTPTIDGERLYALSGDGTLACLKIATGEIIWEKSIKKEYDGVPPEFGYCESPLIDGDKLICSPGGPKAGVVALNKNTGAELWRSELSFVFEKKPYGREGASYASAVVSQGGGVKQYVQLTGWGLVGVHADTGKQLWSTTKAAGWSNPCTPIVRGDFVFGPCGWYSGSVLLKLEPAGDGGVKAKEVYFLTTDKLSTTSGGAILVGDYVYASNARSGVPQCIEFMTGKLMWEKKARGPGAGPAGLAYADGHLYYRYENGVVALVAATPEKFELKGEFHTPGSAKRAWPHPAISDGRLYLRDNGSMYCYDVKKK